ncbi:MAG: Lrp/AsnC family transcriptional regulator [Bacteroidia bacterium]|nr:Lrp/AsnC family transcriptional regulator [Bacteroidia bacterium]
MEKLDTTDRQILRLLQRDGTLNIKQVADEVGLTATPAYERIRRMERSGIISKYVALLNREKAGKPLMVFCHVSLQLHSKPQLKKFESSIVKFDEVMECHHTAGANDYLLKILVRDMNEYSAFITNKLAALDNISRVQSSFVMTEVVSKTEIRLE